MSQERETRPDLCHKCGRCCKTAITGITHAELLANAAEGNDGAAGFLRVFEPLDSIDAARKIDSQHVDRILTELVDKQGQQLDDITFYHCRYVTETGLCGIYHDRPECCKRAPSNGWMLMPTGCGFEGWQFLIREKQKAAIRQMKQTHYQMTVLKNSGLSTPVMNESYDALTQDVAKAEEHWEKYGAKHW